MVPLASGVLTCTFGSRQHPVLKTVRIIKGEDWAEAVGTPILATFKSEISFHGDGYSYGHVVPLAHHQGREILYPTIQRCALAESVRTKVKAGNAIGYEGTTGRLSTRPRQHTELYQDG
jgi:murein DD-endopeptidase MepM/ murein hydrolase activator NlpD